MTLVSPRVLDYLPVENQPSSPKLPRNIGFPCNSNLYHCMPSATVGNGRLLLTVQWATS